MLDQEPREAVERLARAVLSVKLLIAQLEGPVRVWPYPEENKVAVPLADCSADSYTGLRELIKHVATATGAPGLTFCAGNGRPEQTTFERIVANRLWADGPYEAGCRLPSSTVERIVEEVVRDDFGPRFNGSQITSFDGFPLKVYSAGTARDRAVVIVPACGMPANLSERWMRLLENDYYVITWESRGLFGEGGDFDAAAHDVPAQAEDLFAVMDHFEVRVGHLMGHCGGAVIALAAASSQPARVSSLSLWHGDYEFGPNCPKTRHQTHLKALLSMAAESRAAAASIREAFCHSTLLTNISSDLAHLYVYPFTNAELLFRYAKLNGSIMSTDVGSIAEKIEHPTLVVTSQDDDTSHPAGSRLLAACLPNATLRILRHGDLLSMYKALTEVTGPATRFISANL